MEENLNKKLNLIKELLNNFLPEDKKIKDNHDKLIKEFFFKFYKNISKKYDIYNIKLSNEFLISAKENLLISQYTYEKNLYSASIHNLALATEKLSKAYALAFVHRKNFIEKIINIRHKSPLVYLKIAEEEPYKIFLRIVESLFELRVYSNLEELKNLVDEIIRNKQFMIKIAKTKKEEIESILKVYQNIENIDIDSAKNNIKNLLSILPQNQQKMENNIINFQLIFKLMFSFTELGPVTIITFPHYIPSNYPDDTYLNNKKEINYNTELGIVNAFSKIIKILEKSYETLNEYLKRLSKTYIKNEN